MRKNMEMHKGLIHSQRILLGLTQKGVSREKAYEIVQKSAMTVWNEGVDFLDELKKDESVMDGFSKEELEDKFDLGYHSKYIDSIFQKVFG